MSHLRLAFPPPDNRHPGRMWCFLPTEKECPFPLHLHGDFLLTDDRSDLQGRNAYNDALLAEVPRLLEQALRGPLRQRDDMWRFLSPSAHKTEQLVQLVSDWFLDDERRLVELAAEIFGTLDDGPHLHPRQLFDSFWDMVDGWHVGLSSAGQQKRTRRNQVKYRLLEPLRQREVCCLPVSPDPTHDGLMTGTSIPRGPNRLFLRTLREGDGPDGLARFPVWLARQGLQVSWYLPDAAKQLEDLLCWSPF